jgi:hypothetical protein
MRTLLTNSTKHGKKTRQDKTRQDKTRQKNKKRQLVFFFEGFFREKIERETGSKQVAAMFSHLASIPDRLCQRCFSIGTAQPEAAAIHMPGCPKTSDIDAFYAAKRESKGWFEIYPEAVLDAAESHYLAEKAWREAENRIQADHSLGIFWIEEAEEWRRRCVKAHAHYEKVAESVPTDVHTLGQAVHTWRTMHPKKLEVGSPAYRAFWKASGEKCIATSTLIHHSNAVNKKVTAAVLPCPEERVQQEDTENSMCYNCGDFDHETTECTA